MIARALLYWHTLRHLKPIQIFDRVFRRFRLEPGPPDGPLVISEWERLPDPPIRRPRSFIDEHRFRLLEQERTLSPGQGWQVPKASRLWQYNLHYFGGLLHPGTPSALKQAVVSDWIVNNPAGTAPGWEPYPISIRISNWIKWALLPSDVVDGFDRSLYHQARYLVRSLEYHLLGNHLFANAKALVMAGMYFDGKEAAAWRRRGEDILAEELNEQFLADGGHFELSPVYHALLTEDLLDLLALYRAKGASPPLNLESVASCAVAWMVNMTGPDGLPPLFNDAALGVAPTLEELKGRSESLGLEVAEAPARGTHYLEASGYVRHEALDYTMVADVGEVGPLYIPGHGHCDMLSFVLWVRGVPVVVDTGTSTYDPGSRRSQERGTAAHNTVQIGDWEQSEVWGGFRVARRARILDVSVSNGLVEATAEVFPHRPTTHRRRFVLDDHGVVVTDELSPASSSRATARLHFHPRVNPELVGEEVRVGDLSVTFLGAESVKLLPYEYAPRFNVRAPGVVAEVAFDWRLETRIAV